jgi:putative DNA primase/helicase
MTDSTNLDGSGSDSYAYVLAYLVGLYSQTPQGLLWIGGHADGWRGKTFTVPDEAARYAMELDARGGAGVYHRSTTLAHVPDKRGGAEDSWMVHYFALDGDVRGPGHKAENLPAGREDLESLIEAARFPAPTLWVASGGGFYPQWRFHEPIDVREPATREWVTEAFAQMSAHFLVKADERGWKLDNVRDLARVFRLPGTTNRKVPEAPVTARVLDAEGERHDMGALVGIVRRAVRRATPAPAAAADDLFDDATGGDERVFTEKQALEFLTRERAKLAATRSGFNSAINAFAMACAHFPWLVDRERCARNVIKALGPVTGWTEPDQQDRMTINSAYSATEAGKSWVAVRREDRTVSGNPSDEPEDRWTDAMLAGRLAREVLTGKALYTTALGWLVHDGCRYVARPDEIMHESARRWVLLQYAKAVDDYRALANPDHKLSEDPAVRGWAGAQGANRLTSMVRLARGILLRDAAEFDADPDVLNTPAGVVNLRTNEISVHDPALLITKMTAVAYHPNATSDALDRALSAVPEDARDWLQVRLGEAASGHSGEQLVLVTGTGRNGKTALMGAVYRALGDYAAKVPNTLLLRTRQAGGATPERMTLRGVRLAYMEETPEDGYLDATVVKDLLDAEEIEGRHLYRDIVHWRPSHSLFLNTNHPPTMGDTGDGAWRRLTRIDFPFRFRRTGEPIEEPQDREGDPHLKRHLASTEGLESVLAWILAGAGVMYAAGSVEESGPEPASVKASMKQWREESDDLLRFIGQEMAFAPDGHVARSDMYQAFAAWLRTNGHRALSAKTFGQRMGGHSLLRSRVGVRRVARGQEGLTRPAHLLHEGLVAPLGERFWAYGGLAFVNDQGA